MITGHVEATLWQTCQRCLQDVAIPVDSDFKLVLVQGLDEAEALSEEFDPLMTAKEIDLLDLLEEELLLCLPVVARHEECRTGQYDDEPVSAEPLENPFRVLQKLKSRK